MARWLVPLGGEDFDLEEFVRWFPTGEVYVIKESDRFYLVGPKLEALAEAEAVFNEAQRIINQFAAIILLLDPAVRCPTIDGLHRETDEGKRNQFIFASAVLTIRTRLNARGNVGDDHQSLKDTIAQDMLQRVTGDPHLEAAIALWGKPTRSWPQLYRILEEIEQYLKKSVDSAGLCSASERKLFKRTANAAEAAGEEARHALKKFQPSTNPMTIEEANQFIGRLLNDLLR